MTDAGKKILIVDDHEDGRSALRALLELDGHEVTEAATGAEGVKLVESCHPEVIVLDLALPGIDGLEVIESIRALHTERVPFVIAYTGCAELEPRARAAGCDAFVLKPTEPGRLEALIATVPERPPFGSSSPPRAA